MKYSSLRCSVWLKAFTDTAGEVKVELLASTSLMIAVKALVRPTVSSAVKYNPLPSMAVEFSSGWSS